MDPPTLDTHLTDLTAQIDNLTTALSPLLKAPLHSTASTLPLLDKAKLYIHLSYTIESLLYSSLLTAGVDAKSHPIFAELARLKTYFKKIKDAEDGPAEEAKRVGLDKEAAGRFIRHGLAGNEKYDRERAERIAKEKARAALKARELNKKFDDEEESRKQAALPKEPVAPAGDSDEEEDSESGEIDVEAENADIYGGETGDLDAGMNDAYDQEASTATTRIPKRKKPSRKDESGRPKSREEMKAERRAKKQEKRRERSEVGEKQPDMVLPARGQAPKSHSETFKALLEGPLKIKDNSGKKSKGKAKK